MNLHEFISNLPDELVEMLEERGIAKVSRINAADYIGLSKADMKRKVTEDIYASYPYKDKCDISEFAHKYADRIDAFMIELEEVIANAPEDEVAKAKERNMRDEMSEDVDNENGKFKCPNCDNWHNALTNAELSKGLLDMHDLVLDLHKRNLQLEEDVRVLKSNMMWQRNSAKH